MEHCKTIMAGTILKVLVKKGDLVKVGQDVMILESMKMEIPITTESTGEVSKINVLEGDFVNEGEIVVEIS